MAQNYEIDIKRFNGQDYDTLLPTPASHAATHQADGSDPLTLQAGNYGGASIPTSAYQDTSVTRSKLAQDALYSPVINISSSAFEIDSSHLGKTLAANKSSTDIIITVTAEQSASFTNGGEIAVLWQQANSVKIACGDGVYFGVAGNSGFKTITVELPEQFAMCALKKLYSSSGKSYWIVTGNVEVVS